MFLTFPPEQLQRSQTGQSLRSQPYWCHEKRSLTSSLCEQCLWHADSPFPVQANGVQTKENTVIENYIFDYTVLLCLVRNMIFPP